MRIFDFIKIKYRLFVLGSSEVCMPIDIFSLSRKLEEMYPDPMVDRVIESYKNSDSAFVRRVVVIAIQYIGGDYAGSKINLIREFLSDDNYWVSYDAISALAELGNLSGSDRLVISQYAEEYNGLSTSELDKIEPENALQHRNKLAAETLLRLKFG